ncbi:MAG: hypothetical protein ACRC0W_02635 [Cetobacterium sp.]
MNKMDMLEKKILVAIYEMGPTFISKLSNRILENQNVVTEKIKKMQKEKILQRVENIMVTYKTKEQNKVIKHRNHTYYQLTKLGEKLAKEVEEVQLDLREAFKTYNKSLQNILDNEKVKEQEIDVVIDYPYGKDEEVKKILGETYNNLERTYDKMIVLRGKISNEQRDELNKIPNMVII